MELRSRSSEFGEGGPGASYSRWLEALKALGDGIGVTIEGGLDASCILGKRGWHLIVASCTLYVVEAATASLMRQLPSLFSTNGG